MSSHCNKYPGCGCPSEIGMKCGDVENILTESDHLVLGNRRTAALHFNTPFEKGQVMVVGAGHVGKSVMFAEEAMRAMKDHTGPVMIKGGDDGLTEMMLLESLPEGIEHFNNSEVKNRMRMGYMNEELSKEAWIKKAPIVKELFDKVEGKRGEYKPSKHHNSKQGPAKRKKVKRNTCKKRR